MCLLESLWFSINLRGLKKKNKCMYITKPEKSAQRCIYEVEWGEESQNPLTGEAQSKV